jgi:acetoin:2,6-dichlorophenolindophenol oxidoreductase subunit beta
VRELSYGRALTEALREEMGRDAAVFVAGEDVGIGGAFGVTRGLKAEFGAARVKDTPISETAIIGSAIGAAVTGLRPVVDIMFFDFIGVCMDQLLNQAAKMRYMFGGKAKLPLVIRTCGGAGFSAAAQHSQSLEALVVHIPGLKVVLPATPRDAKGLLKSAIRDDNPVVFVEHKMLYGMKGPVPEDEHLTPLGSAETVREGKDVTIVSWSRMVHVALAGAKTLAKEGREAEVIDLRSLAPLDREAVLRSVRKTGKLVILHEACVTGGCGAEIAAFVADRGFDFLDAPIKRVAAPDTPVPFSPPLEAFFLPDEAKLLAAVREIL